jgi:hypothetical protein
MTFSSLQYVINYSTHCIIQQTSWNYLSLLTEILCLLPNISHPTTPSNHRSTLFPSILYSKVGRIEMF